MSEVLSFRPASIPPGERWEFVVWTCEVDHPGLFVVTPWRVEPFDEFPALRYATAQSIEFARALIPPGLSPRARAESDGPETVEVWG